MESNLDLSIRAGANTHSCLDADVVVFTCSQHEALTALVTPSGIGERGRDRGRGRKEGQRERGGGGRWGREKGRERERGGGGQTNRHTDRQRGGCEGTDRETNI